MEQEPIPALDVVRMLDEMCDFCDRSDESQYGTLSTTLVREYIRDLRASLSLPSSGDGRDAEPSLTNDQMREIAMAHASRNWVNDYPQSIESVCKMALAMSQGSSHDR